MAETPTNPLSLISPTLREMVQDEIALAYLRRKGDPSALEKPPTAGAFAYGRGLSAHGEAGYVEHQQLRRRTISELLARRKADLAMAGAVPAGATTLPAPIHDRPVFVKDANGWSVNIAAHDAWYREERARRKAKIAEVHPDRGGSTKQARAAIKAYHDFLDREDAWYAQHGLEPPGHGA